MVEAVLYVFVLGYLFIVFENKLGINKASVAILTGVVCWVYIMMSEEYSDVNQILVDHLGSISGILFFLLGAMTIVELIDAHDGFHFIIEKIKIKDKKRFVWLISVITFFLSAVLDNLTTAIVMTTLSSKMIENRRELWLLCGLIIISANAGGAWSPVGDVTTTMLWIENQITTLEIILAVFPAAFVSAIVATALVARMFKGSIEFKHGNQNGSISIYDRNLVFFLGLGSILFVPVFKSITHLPPYMGMLFSLSLVWIVTEIMHRGKGDAEKGLLSINHALRKIDTPSILFFLGILLAISSLETVGSLKIIANNLDQHVPNVTANGTLIGLISAVIDNVPLVAACQGMYPLGRYPQDDYFWHLLAYAAGTGGSCLIVGSAAGVAVMGLVKVDFLWYLKNVSIIALVSFLAGILVIALQYNLFY
ncbi:MAG TPA: sodium:proton antiporter NhaD [Saprospiraceae bacterium]|nr:sodium:proton antiporter NhaD [Saprospiraceae bacterium]